MLCVVFVLTTVSSGVFAADSVCLSGDVSYLVDGVVRLTRSNGSTVSASVKSGSHPNMGQYSFDENGVSFSSFSITLSFSDSDLKYFSGRYFDVFCNIGFISGSQNCLVNRFNPVSVSANSSGVGVPCDGGLVWANNYDYSGLCNSVNYPPQLSAFWSFSASFSAPILPSSSISITANPSPNLLIFPVSPNSMYCYILDFCVVSYPDKDTYDLCQKIYSRLGTMDGRLGTMDGRLVSIVNSLSTVLNDLSLLIKTTNNIDVLCDDINGAINTGNGIAEQIRSMVNQRLQSVLDYFMYAFFQSNSISHENSWLARIVNIFFDDMYYTYSYYDSDTQQWEHSDDNFLTSVSTNLQVLLDSTLQLDKVDSFGASAYDKADEAGVDDMYDSAIGAGTASKTDANNFVSGGLDSLGNLGSPGDLDGYTNDYYSWFSGKTADSLDSQFGKDSRGINSSLPVIVTDYYSSASKRWNSDD